MDLKRRTYGILSTPKRKQNQSQQHNPISLEVTRSY